GRRWRWRGPGILVRDPGGRGADGYVLRGGDARSARRMGGGLRGTSGHCLGLLGGRLHRRGPQHHGLLEISLLSADRGCWLSDELQLVLAELDHVVVLQEVLLDRVAVDDRAVGAAEVL